MRLIDADALIEFIENRYEITWDSGTYEGGIKDACTDILEKIDNMETIKPESNCSESPNGWIPCTKKKHPDKDMFCHVTVIDDDGDYIVDDDDWDVDSESWDEYSDDEIIAWMPEIQPYQPKEDES